MRRKIIAALLALIMLFGAMPSGLAYITPKHNKQVEYVLFGQDNYHIGKSQKEKDAIKALQYALYLCVDQTDNSKRDSDNIPGEEKLNWLSKDYHVSNLPSIEEINFEGDVGAHRQYTHKGWEPTTIPEKGNWPKRKDILLYTVNRVFNFSFGSHITLFGKTLFKPTEQCDAFAALLYYIHIIGDIESMDTYSKYLDQRDYTMPLVDNNNPDILSELTDIYLPRLLVNCQKEVSNYETLIKKLNDKASQARHGYYTLDNISNEEDYKDYRNLATEVLDIMAEYMPKLLTQEKFFRDVFGVAR